MAVALYNGASERDRDEAARHNLRFVPLASGYDNKTRADLFKATA